MKKAILLFSLMATLFFACDKDKLCPVIDAAAVPQVVKENFNTQYGINAVVETWFDVDGTGYCAKFIKAGKTVFAHFKTDGAFVKESADEDDDENEGTCECE